jgi:predicted histidine transporter YuiF (NhaC family)
MIGEILGAVHRLDDWLRATLGRTYHAALGFGLVLEIVGHVRDLREALTTSAGLVRLVSVLLLYLLLLVHQIGELSEHAERRRRALRDGR